MEECETVPDICMVDVNMPVMNGFETDKVLKQNYPEVEILAFIVNDDEKDVVKMLQCRADGYILNGADPDEIKEAAEVILSGSRYFSAGVYEMGRKYFRL